MGSPTDPAVLTATRHEARAVDVLGRIASALGRQSSDFSSEALSIDEAGAVELLTLWIALRSDPARARVLSAARAAAAAQTN